jgi:hypothetical protein
MILALDAQILMQKHKRYEKIRQYASTNQFHNSEL